MSSDDDRYAPGLGVSRSHPSTEEMDISLNDVGLTRREFLTVASMVTASMAVGIPVHAEQSAADATQKCAGACDVEITINAKPHRLSLDPRVTLLDLLRENLALTGTKKGCDHGQCGACTVLANGRRINSCLSLAVSHYGDSIVTIEGLAAGGQLHPVQAAFLQHDGLQCGYCTPGQICSAVATLDEAANGDASFVTTKLSTIAPVTLTDEEIRERMSGNICRCGAYRGIVEAVRACAAKQRL